MLDFIGIVLFIISGLIIPLKQKV